MFTSISTDRLTLRPVESSDAVALHARRNDPEVSEHQEWTVPFPIERATEIVAAVEAMDGPRPGEWWMATVVEAGATEAIGDIAVLLTWQGRTAEIGYTFARPFWGKGYAVESVGAMVDWLFELGVTRVTATVHPDNRASAMVLERNGFLHEGHTRLSYWTGDEVSDDWIYGLVRTDRETWKSRPTSPPSVVGLIPIDVHNERAVYRLRTHKTQEQFVAPMGDSYADALFPEWVDGAPVVPWMRGVTADDELVGFVMLAVTTEHHPEPFLWRLLVDRMHQRRGIGGRILRLVADECRAMGDRTLLTSWVEGKGSPAPFYIANGFEATGRIVDGETEARKHLD